MPALAVVLLLAAPPAPGPGEVRLPLRDYLALVESVEAREAAEARAQRQVEPSVAELVSQRVSLDIGDADAAVTSAWEVEIRGPVKGTVALPLSGVAQRVTVEPPGPAAVRSTRGGLELVAPAPGRYRIVAQGRLDVEHDGGVDRLALAPMVAPVAELELSLPAGRQWRCANAVVAEDAVTADRRRVRLSLPRSQPGLLEVRRDTKPQEPAAALAAAVSLTFVTLGRDAVRRQDVVLYEVQRGEIAAMTLTLPAGVEPDAVLTDEGPATPWLEGRTLRVERKAKLTGSGYIAVVSQPAAGSAVELQPLAPETKVRARYLAYASDVAARPAPEPEASWSRVDVTDLPAAVQDVAGALGIVAAWRLKQADAPGRLQLAALPAPRLIDGLVRERTTTTLLTVEDTLLHRERFVVDGESAALELALPPGATVWSAQVGDLPVRPVEQAGRVRIPLGVASAAERAVEVVIVQERALPPGRSTLDVGLAQVGWPVLRHDWRLLLPERNRYRYAGGTLRPARAPRGGAEEPPSGALMAPRTRSVRMGTGGSASIYGVVTDSSGGLVPGASVRLVSNATGQRLDLVTDNRGEFQFAGLAGGTYALTAELQGFRTASYRAIAVSSGQTRGFTIVLQVGALAETVEVSAEPGGYRRAPSAKDEAKAAAQVADADQFRQEIGALRQGLVGGVKPVPVKIPEAGKVLNLAGALPPAAVTVSLEVKAPKD